MFILLVDTSNVNLPQFVSFCVALKHVLSLLETIFTLSRLLFIERYKPLSICILENTSWIIPHLMVCHVAHLLVFVVFSPAASQLRSPKREDCELVRESGPPAQIETLTFKGNTGSSPAERCAFPTRRYFIGALCTAVCGARRAKRSRCASYMRISWRVSQEAVQAVNNLTGRFLMFSNCVQQICTVPFF